MKKEIHLQEYAGQILDAVGKGVLLTTKAHGQVNTMVIGWGTLGIQWKEPIFTAFIRQSRYTKQMLEENPEFTVNIPLGKPDPEIIALCGKASGRDTDKIGQLGLSLEEPLTVSVPGIRQMPLTLECKVIYRQNQQISALDSEYAERYYRENTPDEGDFHTAYYGKITAAYLIEEE